MLTTVVIDTRSTEAQKMLEFLKTTRYAKVIEEKIPNIETLQAIDEIESGKVNSYTSVKEMMQKLKESAGV
jgi:hypothetical protein